MILFCNLKKVDFILNVDVVCTCCVNAIYVFATLFDRFSILLIDQIYLNYCGLSNQFRIYTWPEMLILVGKSLKIA